MKLKISDIEFKDRQCIHSNNVIDIDSNPLHEIIDTEPENLKRIIFKEFYEGEPKMSFLEKMVYTQSLASLLKLEIIEDITILNEVADSFSITLTDNVKMMFGFNSKFYDPYIMDYDNTKLNLEEDGSYTLADNVCIERSNRSTHYFRDVLVLSNSESNILMINANESLSGLFKQHQFINFKFDESDDIMTDRLDDYLSKYTNGNSSYDTTFNVVLMELLGGNKYIDDMLDVIHRHQMMKEYTPNINYIETYLNLVEMKAVKLKQPKILFDELIFSINEDDIILGLIKLGFKIF